MAIKLNEARVHSLTITMNSASPALTFSRESYNYIVAPKNGTIAFSPGSTTADGVTNGAGARLAITYDAIIPGQNNNIIDLGSSSYKWKNVYATTFTGNLSGTATKATQDDDGNVIKNTYLKLAGGTMTGNLQIGNSSSSATTADAIGITVRDLRAVSMAPNTLGDRTAVFYFDDTGPSGDASWKGILRVKGWTGAYAAWELAGPATSSDTKEFYVRSGLGGSSWGAWRKLLTSDNYNSYAPTLTGTGASGTWGIGISGNAATATALTSNAGSSSLPIYFTGGKPSAVTNIEIKATDTTTKSIKVTNSNGSVGIHTATNQGLYDFIKSSWIIYRPTGTSSTYIPAWANIGSAYVPTYHGANGVPTAVTANSVITNLASTSGASIFAASPRPGVTGTLPVANGGTGRTSLVTPTVTWTAGSTAGPTLTIKDSLNKSSTAVAIPSASSTASGIITTEAQTIVGAKTIDGLLLKTHRFMNDLTPTAGWYRIAQLDYYQGYFNLLMFFHGAYHYGRPATAVIHLSGEHNTPIIKQIAGDGDTFITQVRITGSSAAYYLEVYCNALDGSSSAQYVSFMGVGSITTTYTPTSPNGAVGSYTSTITLRTMKDTVTFAVADNSATNTGTAVTYDSSSNITLKLPATIKASLTGNVTGNVSGSSGSCTGNAATASKVGASTSWLYFHNSNELNFGGSNTSTTIYVGYRAVDSRAIPAKFIFGGSTGSADLQAKTVYLGSGTTSYISSTQYTGNAATATKLGTSTIGATDRPIYLNSGTATQTTYRMAATNATATTARAITENLETGIWYVSGTSGILNQSDGVAFVNQYNSNWISEIYQDYRTGQIAVRGKNNGTWQAWRKVLDSSNYSSYALPLSGGTVNGNIITAHSTGGETSLRVTHGTNEHLYLWGNNSSGTRGLYDTTKGYIINVTDTSATFTGSLSGNATTASAWATARTLTLAGDLSGSVSVKGNADMTLTATVKDDSHNHVISNIDNLQTNLDNKAGGSNYVDIVVGGDANTYYPVVLANVAGYYPMQFVNISRTYSETAPDTWNNTTHKGGLTMTLLWNGSRYWDGNGSGGPCYCVYKYESYCTMVGGLGNSTGGIVIWLRGGTANYHIHSLNGKAMTATVYLTTYTDSASQSFAPKTTPSAVDIRWPKAWMQGDSVTGAVWNDYAEYRESDCKEFGRVLAEKGDDTLTKTTKRLQPFAGVSSDTWGFCQGKTEKAKTPIAVAGRVLVYTYRNRKEYKPGDVVCAAPNGTVDIMTREEIIKYPDRIVGTVSCVPEYETWGSGDRDPVKVGNRIWIKVN